MTSDAPTQPLEVDDVHGITTIDARFVAPGVACAHMIVQDGRVAFVDVGTAHTTPYLLQALRDRGLDPADVDWVLPTHVHLDHAGGAGTLMRELPNAKLVAHPRAKRHLVDPSKLIASATEVYGAETLQRQYGEIAPIPEERVIEAPEGFEISLAGRTLRFLDTPGHAKHHYCVWDETSRSVFTGDCFGLSYRWADTDRGPWVIPTTTPVQLEPDVMHATLDRLMALEPERAFLTHWGGVGDLARLATDFHRVLGAMTERAEALADAADRHARLADAFAEIYLTDLREHGCTMPEDEVRARLAMDLDLNAQGYEVWLDRQQAA